MLLHIRPIIKSYETELSIEYPSLSRAVTFQANGAPMSWLEDPGSFIPRIKNVKS